MPDLLLSLWDLPLLRGSPLGQLVEFVLDGRGFFVIVTLLVYMSYSASELDSSSEELLLELSG